MSSEVTDLITAFRDGTLTLEQVAERFRQRAWPPRTAPPPETYLELATVAQQDPPPDVPGSFDEVTAAYDRGELSRAAYRRLAEAAASSTAVAPERPAGSESGEAHPAGL
jgi:hypothetical protein